MELKKISKSIWITTPEEERDRPVLGYIKGNKFSVCIDAGNSREHLMEFYNLLKENQLELPKFTVMTHWHWDHTYGMHAVNGYTIAEKNTNKLVKKMMAWKWTDKHMKQRLKEGEVSELSDRCIRKEYMNLNDIVVKAADIVFSNSMTINLGDISCEVFETKSLHCEDSVMIYIPEEKIIFIGDADADNQIQLTSEERQSRIKAMIKVLSEKDIDIVVIGHDRPQSIKEEIDYLQEKLNEIIE